MFKDLQSFKMGDVVWQQLALKEGFGATIQHFQNVAAHEGVLAEHLDAPQARPLVDLVPHGGQAGEEIKMMRMLIRHPLKMSKKMKRR